MSNLRPRPMWKARHDTTAFGSHSHHRELVALKTRQSNNCKLQYQQSSSVTGVSPDSLTDLSFVNTLQWRLDVWQTGVQFPCSKILTWGYNPTRVVNFAITQTAYNNLNNLMCSIFPYESFAASIYTNILTVHGLIEGSASLFNAGTVVFNVVNSEIKVPKGCPKNTQQQYFVNQTTP